MPTGHGDLDSIDIPAAHKPVRVRGSDPYDLASRHG